MDPIQIVTQIWHIDAMMPDAALINAAAQILRSGGLVAFPTETVYGLGANALDSDSVARIFAAKGRPASDPIIVHVHSLDQLPIVAAEIPALAYDLARVFWPGPLTLVLRRSSAVPAVVSAGHDTIAVRMPSHPAAVALLKASGLPIAAPSANRFARPSATTAKHVYEDLNGRIEAILDAGPTNIGVESTILDLTKPIPEVLRPGGVSVESLRSFIPELRVISRHLQVDDQMIEAPGMLLKHYSPRAALRLFSGQPPAVMDAMQKEAFVLKAEGQTFGLLIPDFESSAFIPEPLVSVSLGNSLEEISRHLFDGMRALDQQQVDVILAHLFEPQGLGLALNDRLFRAAEGRLIHVPGHAETK